MKGLVNLVTRNNFEVSNHFSDRGQQVNKRRYFEQFPEWNNGSSEKREEYM